MAGIFARQQISSLLQPCYLSVDLSQDLTNLHLSSVHPKTDREA
jgi:hypothetical protein